MKGMQAISGKEPKLDERVLRAQITSRPSIKGNTTLLACQWSEIPTAFQENNIKPSRSLSTQVEAAVMSGVTFGWKEVQTYAGPWINEISFSNVVKLFANKTPDHCVTIFRCHDMGSDTHESRHEPATLRRDGESARDKSSWKGIFAFTKRAHLHALIPAVTFSVAAGLLQPTMAIIFGKFFNNFSEYAAGRINGEILMQNCLANVYALLGLGLCTLLLKGGLFLCWVRFGEMQAKSVQELLFSSLLARDIEWFDIQSQGMPTSLSKIHMYDRVSLASSSLTPLDTLKQYVWARRNLLAFLYLPCFKPFLPSDSPSTRIGD